MGEMGGADSGPTGWRRAGGRRAPGLEKTENMGAGDKGKLARLAKADTARDGNPAQVSHPLRRIAIA